MLSPKRKAKTTCPGKDVRNLSELPAVFSQTLQFSDSGYTTADSRWNRLFLSRVRFICRPGKVFCTKVCGIRNSALARSEFGPILPIENGAKIAWSVYDRGHVSRLSKRGDSFDYKWTQIRAAHRCAANVLD